MVRKSEWSWDGSVKRYREKNGRFLAESRVVQFRDNALNLATKRATQYAEQVADGTITPAAFKTKMRRAIKDVYGAEYAFGRGGFKNMTADDWDKVGQAVRRQFDYLDNFVAQIEKGEVSAAQIANRAKMYTDSAVLAHSRGVEASWGITLPSHPTLGTPCGSRCRCAWSIVIEDGATVAYWRLGGDDPCDGCATRAASWNPWKPKA